MRYHTITHVICYEMLAEGGGHQRRSGGLANPHPHPPLLTIYITIIIVSN